MNREVYIDNQLVDITENSAAGYMFTSPIFRDITKILANRTTTYKIPRTIKNARILGFAGMVDVNTDFPYQVHDLEEWRNGLLFIRGKCTLLKVAKKDFELSVIWGNTVNMLRLKDLKLRDLLPPVLEEDKNVNTEYDKKAPAYLKWGRNHFLIGKEINFLETTSEAYAVCFIASKIYFRFTLGCTFSTLLMPLPKSATRKPA